MKILIYQLIIILSQCLADPQENSLKKKLFENYNPEEVPTESPKFPLQVSISFTVEKLLEVDSKHQTISVVGFVDTYWYDYRLTWNSSEYDGLDMIVVSPEKVWLPRFTLTNTARGDFYNELFYSQFYVEIYSDGTVNWFPAGLFSADCDLDIKYFPYDQQVCHFTFENWVYPISRVNLSHIFDTKTNYMRYFSNNNGLWYVQDSMVTHMLKDYGFGYPYPIVFYFFKLQRKNLFYGTNIIFLTTILAILVLATFKLPAESGEKVSFAVSLLLSFAVYLVIIVDFLPETSTTVPLMSIYLMCFCILTAISVVQSVFALWCYHHIGEGRAPRWVSWFFLGCLSRVFCNSRVQNTIYEYRAKLDLRDNVFAVDDGSSNVQQENRQRNISGMFSRSISVTERTMIINEWQDISRLIDSFGFWLFLVSFILIVLVVIISIPYGGNFVDLEEHIRQQIAMHNKTFNNR
jgi:hypothetical protein